MSTTTEKTQAAVGVRTVELTDPPVALLKRSNDRGTLNVYRSATLQAERQSHLPLDRFFRFCVNTPPGVSMLLMAFLTSIPFAAMMGVAHSIKNTEYIGDPAFHGSWRRLARWLLIVWASVVVLIPLVFTGAACSSWLCCQTVRGERYAPLARTVAVRLIFLISAFAAHQAAVCIFPMTWWSEAGNWTYTLRQAAKFLIIAFGIIFMQGVVLALSSTHYIGGYVGPRSQTSENAVNTLQSLNDLVKPRTNRENHGIIRKVLHKLFHRKKWDLFNDIRRGVCNNSQVKDYSAKIWDQLSDGNPTIKLSDIYERSKKLGRDPEQAHQLFLKLDESGDNEVTRDELDHFVTRTATQLRKRANAMHGIRVLLRKLEVLLTIVMFGIIIFVYTIYFGQGWADDIKTLWTGIVALSFAFSGPVSDLVNSCTFVFSKHAYDVGDTVEIKTKTLIVSRIYLTHTDFEEAQDDGEARKVVQWSHSALTAEAIVNLTRSDDLAEMMKIEAKN